MSQRLDGLKQRLGQLSDLGHAVSLAHWDQQTMMPPRGGEGRAESLATLTRISHEMFVDEETGRLLGKVVDVAPGVVNDALELEGGAMLPLHEDCIRDVDLAEGRILVARGFSDPL